MPFAYYDRLSAKDKAIYRRSDELTTVTLPKAELLHPLVRGLREALGREDRRGVELAAGHLGRGMLRVLGLAPVAIQVLAVRPSSSGGELHGLYTRDDGRPPRIQLWMRTARHRRVVAFRTWTTSSSASRTRSTPRASSEGSPASSGSWSRRRRGPPPLTAPRSLP
jgi:hypothetical protein